MPSFGTTFGQNITMTHYKLRTLQIGLNVEELGDSLVRGNPGVLEMSAYLTAVDCYNEQNAKHTRLLVTIDGFGDFPGLVTKEKLAKGVDDVLNKTGPSFEIPQIPLENILFRREGE